MNITEEQFESVQLMGSLFFDPALVAINLELDDSETELLLLNFKAKNANCKIYTSYMKGYLTSQLELRSAIKQSAINGSSPSQQMMLSFDKETLL